MNRVDQRDIDRRKLEIEEIVNHALQSSRTSGDEIPRNRRLAWFKKPGSNQKSLVLLDPKDYGNNPDDPAGYKVYERVRELALELRGFHETADPIPNTLPCRGWYEDQATAQFYFILHLPPECEMPSINTRIRTLHEMYKKSRPSVGARIKLSRSLAATILQVHRRGWMHKGIRSDNILFFSRTPSSWPDLGKPRLVGFDYARRDNPWEYSEKPM